MEAPSAGAVVLVLFPFSDLTQTVLRPAIVLADAGRGDRVLCQITSNRYADARAIELVEESFRQGGLDRISYARPGKLFTANTKLISRQVGRLTAEVHGDVVDSVVSLIRHPLRSP